MRGRPHRWRLLPVAGGVSHPGITGRARPLGALGVRTLIAAFVRLGALTRNQRGPKKPPVVKPVYDKKHKHYSTARLLEEAEDSC